MRSRTLFASVLITIATAGVLIAASDIPAVSTIADADAAVAPTLQIRSDGLGPYLYKARLLNSVIQPMGEWELDLGMIVKGNGRRAFLGFTQPVPGSGPSGQTPLAPPSQQYVLRFITKCYTVNTSLLNMVAGQQVTCPLFIPFDDYNGNRYRIQMSRAASPTSDDVTIQCLATGTDGRCSQWHVGPGAQYIAPDGSAISASTGTLVKLLTQKGSEVQVLQGDFHFSFSITVVR